MVSYMQGDPEDGNADEPEIMIFNGDAECWEWLWGHQRCFSADGPWCTQLKDKDKAKTS